MHTSRHLLLTGCARGMMHACMQASSHTAGGGGGGGSGSKSGSGGRRSRPRAPSLEREAPASSSSSGSSSEFDLFRSMFGRLHSSSDHKKFHRAWRQWQAASAPGGSSQGSGGRGSGRGGAASGRGSASGSAGTSAGPRWGQASWTWDDFRELGASRGSGSRGGGEFSFFWSFDQETWYEAPPSSSSSSSRRKAGGASGWRSAWEHQFGGTGAGRAWGQHGGGAADVASSSSVHSNLQLLGLEGSWLSGRCGKALRQAYLTKCKAEHPDVHMHAGSGASAADAERRFKLVQAAYTALLALVVP